MTQTRIPLTRAELYEKVWATPMRAIAKEFGMSDVGLAKICRKHDIPVPPGYCLRPEFISRSFPPTLPCAALHGCRSTLIAALFSHAAKPFSHCSRGSLCVTRSQSRMWPCVRIFNIRIQVLTV